MPFLQQVEGATAAVLETGKQSWKEDPVRGSSAILLWQTQKVVPHGCYLTDYFLLGGCCDHRACSY